MATMRPIPEGQEYPMIQRVVLRKLFLLAEIGSALLLRPLGGWAQPVAQDAGSNSAAALLEVENVVEVQRAGSVVWDPARTNQVLYPGDQVRTGERSRAAVRLSNRVVMRVGELSQFQLPSAPMARPVGLRFFKGMLYFFHREKPDDFEIRTPTVSAVIRGTEFTVAVADDQTTVLSLFDGQVVMSNNRGQLTLERGQQGVAASGQAPTVRAMIQGESVNVVQWCLYYPGVLDVDELQLPEDARQPLASSLSAYRSGDLKAALTAYPAGRAPPSAAERVYRAALGLAVGDLDTVTVVLQSAKENAAAGKPADDTTLLALSLEKVVAAVKFQSARLPAEPPATPASATEQLAESYRRQSLNDLAGALSAAREAVGLAPGFGFAWARVAELEMGFGRTGPARDAVENSLKFTPRNAQALALKGFLLAGRNQVADALVYFDRAIAADGALANGWLGRGLCLIRQGQREQGLETIQVAATVEPQRALLRSYLGKAFSHAQSDDRALHELALAKEIDPRDPTAWLYSALIRQEQNSINDAVRDLEKSQSLVGNRRIVRSTHLLDHDRAVGGANLAAIYRDAGMVEVASREAAKAINSDYASYRAHLFLADSYMASFDPGRINLRYETAAVDEYLMANLLAPVGAGPLSPMVTQQEYAQLFEADRLGFASSTEYWSRGDWHQTVAQYGLLHNSSYGVEGSYRSLNGDVPNADLELWTASARFKQQLTPEDSVFLQMVTTRSESGDTTPQYDPALTDQNLRVKETQAPLALLGYHHEWSPVSHTLLLGGYFQDTLQVKNPDAAELLLLKDGAGNVIGVPLAYRPMATNAPPLSALDYESDFDGCTTELQQIFQAGSHGLIGGARLQFGRFDTTSRVGASTPTLFANNSSTSFVAVSSPPIAADYVTDFQRWSLYAYDNWRLADSLLLTAGLSYDNLYYPQDFRSSPVSGGQLRKEQWSPKGGVTWTPTRNTAVRAAYSRALGGVGFDQSFQLEPTQVAGFNQAFRSAIPEAVTGAIAGAPFESWGLALDQRIASGTYLGVTADTLHSELHRYLGTKDVTLAFPPAFSTSTTRQHLDYTERNVLLTLNQLVGRNWAFGAGYRWSHAQLESELLEIPSTVTTVGSTDQEAVLQRVNLFALFNHDSGFFGEFDSIWTGQSNEGYTPDLSGDSFWQFNAGAGYRFPRRTAEVRLAVLNLTSQDYRLNPLNLTAALPRERTLVVSVQLSF